jgi:hypothetical protein
LCKVIGDAGDRFLFHDIFLVTKKGAACVGIERRQHADGHAVKHGELGGAGLQYLGSEGRKLKHLFVGNLRKPAGFGNDPRVRRIDAVHVRVDITAVRLDRGGDSNSAEIGTTASEG